MTNIQHANNTFADVHGVEQLLGELAGAASLCWDPKPEGVFESTRAAELVDHAVTRLSQLIGAL